MSTLEEAEAQSRIVTGFDGSPVVVRPDGWFAGFPQHQEAPVILLRRRDVRADILSGFLSERLDRRLAALQGGTRAHRGVLWMPTPQGRWVSLRRAFLEARGVHVHQIVGRFASSDGGEGDPEDRGSIIEKMIYESGLILIAFSVIPLPLGGCDVTCQGGSLMLAPALEESFLQVLEEIEHRWPEAASEIDRYLGRESAKSEGVPLNENDTGTDPDQSGQPWGVLTDARDRLMVQLWCEGHSVKSIARHTDICLSGRRVRNHIGELRDCWGAEAVPYRRKPKTGYPGTNT